MTYSSGEVVTKVTMAVFHDPSLDLFGGLSRQAKALTSQPNVALEDQVITAAATQLTQDFMTHFTP